MSRDLRSVVVPLDGSPFAERALPLAASIVRHADATLHLLRVLPDLADVHFWAPLPGSKDEREVRLQICREAREYLEGIARRLQTAGPLRVISDLVDENEGVPESIREDIRRVGGDLVVMSYHARGPLARFWLGSVADALVRVISVPVILVPADEPAPNPEQDASLHHILVPLDGTPEAETMLAPSLALAKAMGADFTLLHMIHPQSDAKLEQARQAAAEYLEKVAERLRADGAEVRVRVVVGDRAAPAILTEATAGTDLIAVETHGRRVLSRLLRSSVAHEVVHTSSLPVLVCRLPQREHA